MSINVQHYHTDGASRQAQAVLAVFQQQLGDGIESSWNPEWHRYDAEIKIGRWENCREQGYILSLATDSQGSSGLPRRQLNIAFYEHRSSDDIVAVMWEQVSINSLTIDTADFIKGTAKGTVQYHTEPYGHPLYLARWINTQFEDFWAEYNTRVK